MEYIDIYDENNEAMNIKMEREEAHTKGMWHREILVIVVLVVILFGSNKIPGMMKNLADGLNVFKKEIKDVKQPVKKTTVKKATAKKVAKKK